MATTRIMPMHHIKGKSILQCLRERIDYSKNIEKTAEGEYISAYECDAKTAAAEFALAKREYGILSGREQKNNVIAYQIRQSFRPGEVTPEEANRIGYELAMRFLKGKHAFIVCTHVDKKHLHNHVIFNSTTLDCKRKFKDFLGSGRAVGRLSDIICLEHGLSIIENPKRYTHSTYDKWMGDKKKPSHRELLRGAIDDVLAKQPDGFDAFLQMLNEIGYTTVRRGKNISFRHPDCKSSIRMNSLGEGYTEADIRSVLSGERKHTPKKKWDPLASQKDSLLIDIQRKMDEGKGAGYVNWAKKFNIKQMAQTVNYLREHGLMDYDVLKQTAADATGRYNRLSDEIKSAEKRMAEIAVLRTHIINYSKTRDVYAAYRKAGYSKKFLSEHESDILLHKAAKKAFDELGVTKLPTVKSLQAEYAELLAKKKAAYTEYRTAREEMKELLLHKSNIDRMLEKEEVTHDEQKKRHEHRE
ncbi:MAG: relaxase/mobilization nuclease domain-containing protein [Clostridia bacterium]|nr:relaxase/mobilization nuclease domain-containing protein [Clostridia bacterium]